MLLDNQRFGFALVKAEIESAVFDEKHALQKKVIIVEGPPGSGKSVIAAKVWASLAADSRIDAGRFVLTTTSSAQETNWRHLVQTVVGHHGAGGIVLPANKYAPGTLQELTWLKNNRPGMIRAPAFWPQNLQAREKEKGDPWMPDNHLAVSVVDEAHALINPEHPRAITHSGWPNPYGPQAYHIIRASTVSVFLLDPEQRFRERESTSPADIEEWAKELGAGEITRITLAGAQFRCAGSTEYVAWVEALLKGAPSDDCAQLSRSWMPRPASAMAHRHVAEPVAESNPISLAAAVPRRRSTFEFAVCETPSEMESLLRSKLVGNATARLVSTFARPWKTGDKDRPHDVPLHEQDFFLRWSEGGRERTWARPWNVIPRSNYSSFIQAAPGTRIAHDQLAEVGCTYAVRGFDFDYIGLLWLGDLRWAGDQWSVELDHVFETGLHSTLKAAKRKKGSSGNRVGDSGLFQSSGSMQVRILSRKYSSSRSPYARRWMTRILLLSPSTKPSETLFSGWQ